MRYYRVPFEEPEDQRPVSPAAGSMSPSGTEDSPQLRRVISNVPESSDEPELHRLVVSALEDPGRSGLRELLERGVDRGELRDDLDLELAIDLLAGPVVYRLLIGRGELRGLEQRFERVVELFLAGARKG